MLFFFISFFHSLDLPKTLRGSSYQFLKYREIRSETTSSLSHGDHKHGVNEISIDFNHRWGVWYVYLIRLYSSTNLCK